MTRRRRTVMYASGGVLAAFVALTVVLALSLDGDASEYRGTALLGDPAPALTLPALDGGEVDLAGLRGRAVIVNFWNSWCIPCKEEEPALQAFYAAHAADDDFEMIGIVRDDREGPVRKWVEEHATPWTVTMDPGARAAVDFGTTGQPETYAISPSGVVVAKHLGRATLDDLENLLRLARGRAR